MMSVPAHSPVPMPMPLPVPDSMPPPLSNNITPFPALRERARYGEGKRPNLPVLILSASIAMLALSALMAGHPSEPAKHSERLAVLNIQAPPPPPAAPQQAAPPAPAKIILPQTPLPPPPEAPRIAATLLPQPALSAAEPSERAAPSMPSAASAVPSPAPPATENAGDLSSSMMAATPPRYPQESRRKREQGVVILRLLLGTDGQVSEISVAQSSGFSRLDQAALAAVRRWRWSPTRRNGVAVPVKGLVEIPFVLQER